MLHQAERNAGDLFMLKPHGARTHLHMEHFRSSVVAVAAAPSPISVLVAVSGGSMGSVATVLVVLVASDNGSGKAL